MINRTADAIDRIIFQALVEEASATGVAISERTGLSRNTVRTRLQRYSQEHLLHPFERRLSPKFLGFPLRAFLLITVVQRELDAVGRSLAEIPEVLEVIGISGGADLVVQLAARDSEDLYRIAGMILDIQGIERTETGLVMRELVPYRTAQLISDSDDSP